MTSRILPVEEWSRLVGTEAETIWPQLDPATALVLVVEDGEMIVGTWILLNVVHAECLWIAESHRGHSAVARRLWTTMRKTALAAGYPVIATAALSDEVRALLAHVGAEKIPGDHYVMRVH